MTQTEFPTVVYSATSRAAARAIKPDAGRLRQKVLAAIQKRGGLTDEEGIEITGMSPSTYRPRRIELVEAGKVKDSETVRLTRSGRKAVVWVSTSKG